MDAWLDDLPAGVSRQKIKTPQRLRGRWSPLDASKLSTDDDEDENSSWYRTSRKSKASRKAPNKTKGYGYCATSRSRAARDACIYGWKFVEVHQPVSDVDITKYPYKLVREGRLPDAVACTEALCRQQESTQWQHQWIPGTLYQAPQREGRSNYGAAFLDCFGSGYIKSAARALNGITVEGILTVRAVFGRNLFCLHMLNANQEYQLDRLRTVRHPRDLQSSWSNVCDEDAPIVRALLEELNRTDSVNLEPKKLKLTMRCCLMSKGESQYAKLTYFREDGEWVFADVRRLSGVTSCHDISLDNTTSFRVKVIAELLEPGRAWWGSVNDLVLFDEPHGDPLKTKVSLVSCSDKDLTIEFVTIKHTSDTVNFRGLNFQLSTKQGSTSLQAHPPVQTHANKQVGEAFEFLVSRLVEILDELSE
ncbi:hypothetical protein ON010_g5044 [Phytophthora cinnamomi]|nr:hypothetical protein ON010_g5044 [Phytophthora cinnamomi]